MLTVNVISKELVILSYRQTVGKKGQVREKKKRSYVIMF